MRIFVFSIFLLNLVLFSSCLPALRGVNPQLAAIIEPGSRLMSGTGNSTVEKTADGHYVYKEYYYDTRKLTRYHSYLDARRTVADGPFRTYTDEGELTSEGGYLGGKRQGEWKNYGTNPKTITTTNYVDDLAEGMQVSVDASGRKRTETPFKAGKRQGLARIYNEDGSVKEETLYVDDKPQNKGGDNETLSVLDIQIPPSYPCDARFAAQTPTEMACGERSLLQFLASTIRYPSSARENNVQGSAIATFVVEKDGSVSNIDVIHGLSHDIKAEVYRVLHQMSAWRPGSANGHPVKVRYTLPVRFRLE